MRHLLIACAVVCWVAVGARAQPAAASRTSAVLTAELRQGVQRAELGRFWGAVLVVRRGEVLLAEGFGFANEQLDPIGPDHLFDVGSVTKMFTAAAVLRLEQEGRLSVEDTLLEHFPDAGGNAGAITLRHLLNHTSGKSDRGGAIQPLAFDDRDGAVRLFAGSRSAAAPGERFEYCNGGYVVLGAVVEVVSGKAFEQAVRELVLAPAGMTKSGFLDGGGLDAGKQTLRVVAGARGSGGRRGLVLDKRVEPWGWGLKGAGGLVTSVNDLVAWDRAVRAKNLVGGGAAEKWVTPVKEGYAMGWVVGADGEGRVTHRHGGATRGYRCDLLRYPGEEVMIAVLTGEAGIAPGALADSLGAVLFPPASASTRAVLTVKEEALNKYRAVVADGCTLTGEARDGSFVLRLERADPRRTLATITLDQGAARGLGRSIRGALDSPQHRPAGEGGIRAGVYLYQFPEGAKAGTLEIRDAGWVVNPGYAGRGEDGGPVSDPRIVLILMDPGVQGAWPVMIHVDDPTAVLLHKQLLAFAGVLAE